MKLLVALGNPGPQYELTRHNAGFLVIDELVREAGGTWDKSLKLSGILGKASILKEEFLCLKPMTYMNRSAQSVRPVMDFYKIPEEHMIVLFDDMDVPEGKVRARTGGGHGGHNGVRSLIDQGGLGGFHRIKLGLGRPPPALVPADWLLAPMDQSELERLRGPMIDEVKLRLRQILDQLNKKV